MQVSEQTQNQILAVLRRMAEAMGRKDLDGVMALTDLDFRGFGTGGTVIGREAYRRRLERDFARSETLSLEFFDVHIGAEGTVAWVLADAVYRIVAAGVEETQKRRLTAVLRGTGHAWIFVQQHCSLPAEGQEAGRPYSA
ncbi:MULTISPECIES: nuclear transport factor 2 family protein [unclassified Methanoculleus]|jgi:ketosteroid isomerase-like protein|uniref:nuclear transport factor 2 family protein n=1 Tax=unclassified Methanoculleus TaxID=2619537 RepID=UPI0025E57497|nr:nuclear transport factor 2 family protein [Methanoculleus sp. UBA377]